MDHVDQRGGTAEPAKTLDDLEWQRIVAAVAARCRGPLAARIRLPIAETIDGAKRALDETAEVMRLLEIEERLPLDGAREVGALLDRIAREGALNAPELRDVMKTLEAARALRRFLSARKQSTEALRRACPLDPTLDRLKDELAACIEPDGTLADHASPELKRLRTETANLRARIVGKLERLLLEHADILQDRFHTLREGRYVIPVRRDAHEKVPGIVHATSASGATVFVEPRGLVAQGNRLKMALNEQEREEARILGELSELVRERLPELRAAVAAIDHADLRQASAQLGVDLGGRVLPLLEHAEMSLDDAKHPLLLLDGVDVVAADLPLREGHGMVLSGPNAGGKTVALKTMGLAALMQRAGLPVCAAEGSRLGFFSPVLTDVGDEQSIQKNLSTFSAHVRNVSSILERANRGALVLLDELATGTDPGEGGALACAVLGALLDAGAAVAVTTHYEALKAAATKDERLLNAAVGFDVERMMPTFTLHLGTPGASSALAVAARFGIGEAVIARAREVVPEQSRTFDALVRQLSAQRAELTAAHGRVTEKQERLAAQSDELEERLRKLKARGRKSVDDASAALKKELDALRDELKKTKKTLREKKSERAVADAKAKIDAAVEAVAKTKRAPVKPRGGLRRAEVGQSVWVPQLKSRGEVLELDGARARVQAGALKLWVDVSALQEAEEEERVPRPAPPEPRPDRPPSPRSSDNTIDVRGLRVDDALSMTETFLDRTFGADEKTAYIVHGIGSGALRDAIRAHLERDASYVASFRSGSTEEGGDRLTIVTLK